MAVVTRDEFVATFKERAFRTGDFTLASGQKSSYYIDCKQALFYEPILRYVAPWLWLKVESRKINAVGGLEVGAIPMVVSMLMSWAYFGTGNTPEGFYVRKEAKKHGTGNLIEGRVGAGDRVAIFDDVLTTGASAMKAIKAVEDVGAQVILVACIVDRLQGARELLVGYEFKSLLTIEDLVTPLVG